MANLEYQDDPPSGVDEFKAMKHLLQEARQVAAQEHRIAAGLADELKFVMSVPGVEILVTNARLLQEEE